MQVLSHNRTRIHTLTSIRAFFTLWVVIHHLNLERYTTDSLIVFIDKYFLHTGRGVVSFFFFISGFVICYTSKHWQGWKNFLIKRLSRVYPNHWIVSLTLAGFTFLLPLINGENLFYYVYKAFLNLSLLQSFVPDRTINFAHNGVTWTLSVEMFFYLCFIFIQRMESRNVLRLFTAILVAKLCLESLWVFYDINSFAHWLFFVFPVFRLPEFLLGVLICRLYFKDPGLVSWFKVHPLLIVLLTVLTIGVCRFFFSPYAIFLYSTIPSIFGLFLLLSCLGYESDKKNCFNHPFFLFLGDASYSIYLIHQPILNGTRRLFQALDLPMGVGLMLSLLAISVIIAVGYYVFIERKVYSWSVKFLQKIFGHQVSVSPALSKNTGT